MHPQPEDSRQPETEPASKRRGDDAQEVVEYGYGLGYHHTEGPDGQGDDEPGDGRQLGPPNGVLRVTEYAREDVLGRNVGVDDSRDSNCGNGDSPNHLADRGAPSSGKSRRWNVGPDVDVDDDSRDNVERGVCDLQECQSLWPVVRVFELGYDAEEDGVAGCGTMWIRIYGTVPDICWFDAGRYLQKALEILVTARKAGAKPRDLNTSMVPLPMGFSIPTSTTVMSTATRIEMQAF